LDLNLETILLSPSGYPLESGGDVTPHLLIGFASEYMRWKALLKVFPCVEVLSMTTHDNLDPNLETILLSPSRYPSESGGDVTPYLPIGFALEYMH
jgi:hypothetical protein